MNSDGFCQLGSFSGHHEQEQEQVWDARGICRVHPVGTTEHKGKNWNWKAMDRKRKAMLPATESYDIASGAGLPVHALLEDTVEEKNLPLEDAMKYARKDTLDSLQNRERETARVKSEDHDRAIDDFKAKVGKISVLEDETELGKEEETGIIPWEMKMRLEQLEAEAAEMFSVFRMVQDLIARADEDLIGRRCNVECARLYACSMVETEKKAEASWASYFDTFTEQHWEELGLPHLFRGSGPEDDLDHARFREDNVKELLKHGIKGIDCPAHLAAPLQQAVAIKMLEVKGDMDAYQKEKDLFHYVHGEELNDFLDI